jgi:hypothetical protein
MAGDLLSPAASLFRGAAETQEGLLANQTKRLEGAADRSSAFQRDVVGQGIQQVGAAQRQQASEKAAGDRQQVEIESQFLTLTPVLKKGAAEVTGDKSWHDIPDGYKMRADVYSGLITAGVRMNEVDKPKVLQVQEGDQVYEAEYDPKTRKLRKLTAGGEKWNPDAGKGKGTGASGKNLNPMTLQTRIAQDEKTLLTAMNAKGGKGVPGTGLFGHTFDTDKDVAKLASYKTIAQRLKDNYANLQQISDQQGLQFTPPSEETLTAMNTLLGEEKPTVTPAAPTPAQATPKPAPAASTMVLVISPNGQRGYVPRAKLKEKISAGYKLAQ